MRDVPSVPGVDQWFMGLDIGRRSDYSARIIIARTWQETPQGHETVYTVMHAKRYKLGTPFAIVEEDCANAYHDPMLMRPIFCADVTGVGDPVVEALRRDYHCRTIAIHITGGSKMTQPEEGRYNVGKEEIVTNFIRLVGRRRFRIHRSTGEEGEELWNQMGNFSYRPSPSTHHMTFEADAGEHDDMVLAAALPVWYGETHRRGAIPGKPKAFVEEMPDPLS